MSWIVYGIVGVFLWAIANVFDKIMRASFLKSTMPLVIGFTLVHFPLSLFLVIQNKAYLTPTNYLIPAFISGVAITCAIMAYIKALSREEASRVVTFFQLTPVFVLVLAAVFLKERLLVSEYLAFILLLSGGLLISIKKIKDQFHLSPAIWLMIVSCFCAAIAQTLLKFAHALNSFWNIFSLFYFGMGSGYFILFVLNSKARNNLFQTMKNKVFLFLLLSSGVLSFLGFMLHNKAILTGPVTIVSTFSSIQSFFVLVIATVLSIQFPKYIQEDKNPKVLGVKLIAILLMFMGLALLSFGSF